MLRPFVLSRASFDRCSGCDNPVKAPLVIVDSGDEYEQQAVRLCYACLKRAVEVATCPACFELNTPPVRAIAARAPSVPRTEMLDQVSMNSEGRYECERCHDSWDRKSSRVDEPHVCEDIAEEIDQAESAAEEAERAAIVAWLRNLGEHGQYDDIAKRIEDEEHVR